MPIEVTESMIRAGAAKEIFARGKKYDRDGAIYEASISGNTLMAKCRGCYAPHYTVRVELDDTGIRDAACTCEYDGGGYCKHIVALSLAYMRDPASFEQRPEPHALLRRRAERAAPQRMPEPAGWQ